MAKRSSRVVWCDRPWYWPHYGLVPDLEAWEHQMRCFECMQPYPKSHASTSMFNTPDNRTACLVTVSPEARPCLVAGVLAHEAVHVYQHVVDYMGEKVPGVEAQAYGIQDIFQNLVKSYEQTRGRLFLKGVSAETVT